MTVKTIDRCHVTPGLCGSDGAEGHVTYGLRVIFADGDIAEFPDFSADRLLTQEAARRLTGASTSLENLFEIVEDFLV